MTSLSSKEFKEIFEPSKVCEFSKEDFENVDISKVEDDLFNQENLTEYQQLLRREIGLLAISMAYDKKESLEKIVDELIKDSSTDLLLTTGSNFSLEN